MSEQAADFGAQTLLVTGAASGIGAAVAARFAQAGIGALYLLDIDAGGLAEVAAALSADGARCEFEAVDVRDEGALQSAFARAHGLQGRLDFVHNNVGVMTGFPPFPDTPVDQLDRVLAVNLRGVILGVQLALAHMDERGGSILNTSSLAASLPLPSDPIYAGTKAAINQFTRSAAPALAKRQVRINAVCPGMVDTAILAQNQHPQYQPTSSAAVLEAQGYELLQATDIAAVAFELLTEPALTGETRVVGNQRRGNHA